MARSPVDGLKTIRTETSRPACRWRGGTAGAAAAGGQEARAIAGWDARAGCACLYGHGSRAWKCPVCWQRDDTSVQLWTGLQARADAADLITTRPQPT